MLIRRAREDKEAEYKRLTDVLRLFATQEGVSDIREVARSIELIGNSHQVYLPCNETGRNLLRHCQRELFAIANAPSTEEIDQIEAYKIQNCDTRRYEPIFIGDIWIRHDDFSKFLINAYAAKGLKGLDEWITFLTENWRLASETLQNLINDKDNTKEFSNNEQYELDENLEQIRLLLEGSHPHQADGLMIALQAWLVVSRLTDVTVKSESSIKIQISKWLEERFGQTLSNSQKERISTIANWDQTGGRPRSSD